MTTVCPKRIQVQLRDWEAVCRQWNLRPADFDLTRPNARLAEHCRAADILFCDLTERFRKAALRHNLYLQGDEHFNARGHREAALGVARFLQEARVLR